MKKYYALGKGYKTSKNEGKILFEIGLYPDEEIFPFVMLQGEGVGGVGGVVKPSDMLKPHWKEHLGITNTEWILPFCADAVSNDDKLDIDSVVEFYKYKNGSFPKLKT